MTVKPENWFIPLYTTATSQWINDHTIILCINYSYKLVPILTYSTAAVNIRSLNSLFSFNKSN